MPSSAGKKKVERPAGLSEEHLLALDRLVAGRRRGRRRLGGHPTGDFFFNDTATTELYTLSLHDALPTSPMSGRLGPWISYGRNWSSAAGSGSSGRSGAEGLAACGARWTKRPAARWP